MTSRHESMVLLGAMVYFEAQETLREMRRKKAELVEKLSAFKQTDFEDTPYILVCLESVRAVNLQREDDAVIATLAPLWDGTLMTADGAAELIRKIQIADLAEGTQTPLTPMTVVEAHKAGIEILDQHIKNVGESSEEIRRNYKLPPVFKDE